MLSSQNVVQSEPIDFFPLVPKEFPTVFLWMISSSRLIHPQHLGYNYQSSTISVENVQNFVDELCILLIFQKNLWIVHCEEAIYPQFPFHCYPTAP
ncbi:hypothetical protein B7C51_10000 [Paenibacillus larvae subsp. pulvifaciens]|uniref:Uncharacterized protein n=1 Tax=Paenibacillus larvae subsp. pulvifaciens TaxID=1477 RepID=A0A1V0USY0_9BACL|nr:hypothetical protein B7C51_10000 [Paenibacillus larvae subsp. pulvifaciens]